MWIAPLIYFVVSVVLWKLGNGLFVPELVANRLFEIFPVTFIEAAVQLLGPLAEELAFYSITVVYFSLYFLFAYRWDRMRPYLGNAFYAGFALWGVHVLVLIPALGQGIFGYKSPQGALSPSILMFASHWIFARSLQFQGFRTQPAVTKTGRRVFVAAAAAAVVAAVVRGYRVFFKPAKWSDEVTPTGDFYTVSKNSVDPVVPEAGWKLDVHGANGIMSYTLAQLRQLPSITMFATLACISNPVGGDWLGNARWTGVPLGLLLQKSGIAKGTQDVVLRAADGYSDSIPIERALQPFCFLAHEMNGAPLTSSHGSPLRLIVPGIYGMKNVKWITSIEQADRDYRGFWQRRGWDDVAHYKLMSRIDIARDGFVAGVAFAGDRGVDSVQVRIGDGAWQEAELKPELSPITWVLWSLKADVKGKGVMVRMKSRDGEFQIAEPMPPFPEGSSGLHTVVGS
jgi:DMSO/TMAO reductase YedYZ molybdopterin-dependent catalytic subunit